jgi:hypothetical protein
VERERGVWEEEKMSFWGERREREKKGGREGERGLKERDREQWRGREEVWEGEEKRGERGGAGREH